MAKITGKGSFAGVPFLIEDSQSIDGGRRLVKHEYPLRDEGLTEDLGKKLRTYNISCLVIGDNHMKQAEKLIEALEKGKGELKHPYFKNLDVWVESYKATYSTGHQRVTRFEISFTPDVQENAPAASKNTLFAVLEEYTNSINALSDEFASQIAEINEFMELLVDNPVTQLMDSVLSFADTIVDSISSVIANVGEVKNKLQATRGRLTNLIRSPQLLAKALQDAVSFGGSKTLVTQSNGQTALSKTNFALRQALSQRTMTRHILQQSISEQMATKTEMAKATFDRIIQAKRNQMGGSAILATYARGVPQQELVQALMTKAQFNLARLVTSTLAVEYAKSVVDDLTLSLNKQAVIIESKSDIQRFIQDIDEQLEAVILANADAENWQSYTALEQFRLAVLSDLRTRGEQLTNARQIYLTDTFPALAVQYAYTGDSRQWQQLVLRNGIKHPLFCLGGNNIEVLQ